MLRKSVLALAATGLFLGTFGTPAFAGGGVEIGWLKCDVAGGWGYIIGSARKIVCMYEGSGNGPVEHYTGKISKLGVDIGYVRRATVVWGVFTPTTTVTPGALAGNYFGATAGATLGVGGDINALVGGEANSFSLQPLSMESDKGLNLAAGMETLTLKYQPMFPNLR